MWAYKELHCSLCKHDFYRHSDKLTSHNPLQNTTKKKNYSISLYQPQALIMRGCGQQHVLESGGGGCVRSQTASLLKPALLSCYQT